MPYTDGSDNDGREPGFATPLRFNDSDTDNDDDPPGFESVNRSAALGETKNNQSATTCVGAHFTPGANSVSVPNTVQTLAATIVHGTFPPGFESVNRSTALGETNNQSATTSVGAHFTPGANSVSVPNTVPTLATTIVPGTFMGGMEIPSDGGGVSLPADGFREQETYRAYMQSINKLPEYTANEAMMRNLHMEERADVWNDLYLHNLFVTSGIDSANDLPITQGQIEGACSKYLYLPELSWRKHKRSTYRRCLRSCQLFDVCGYVLNEASYARPTSSIK